MAKKARRGRPRDAARAERRREEILAAATTLFAERGFRATDLQEVADSLGIGKGTVYRYFPSKRELFLAAADRAMRLTRAHVEGAADRATDPLDRIARAIEAYLEFFDRHSEFVELLIQERAEFRDRKKPTYFEYRDANVGVWNDLYRSLIAAGRVRDVPVERLTNVSGDLLYGAMFTNYFAGRRRPLKEQAEDVVDVLFHGILTPEEARRRSS